MMHVRLMIAGVAGLMFATTFADAKVATSLQASPHPAFVQEVAVITVRAKLDPGETGCMGMKVDAVAPGFSVIDALRRLDGYPQTRPVPGRVFRLRSLRGLGNGIWAARVAFPVAGTWRLVVPNFCGADGYVLPEGVRTLRVEVSPRRETSSLAKRWDRSSKQKSADRDDHEG